MDNINSGKAMKYKKGSVEKITHDEALLYGSKVKLVDLKKSLFRVLDDIGDAEFKKARKFVEDQKESGKKRAAAKKEADKKAADKQATDKKSKQVKSVAHTATDKG